MILALTLNYRKPELTAACVRSMLREGCDKILVWDNSDDGGHDAAWLTQVFAGDRRVEVLYSSCNLGFAAGVNAGLKHLMASSSKQRVLLINNDATLEQGALLALTTAMDSPAQPVIVAPRIVQDGVEFGWMHYHRWLGLVLRRPWPGTMPYLSGCCLLVDTSRAGTPLLDEDFYMYGEDVALSHRLQQAGLALILEPSALVRHVGSAGSGAGSLFYEVQIVRSHLLLIENLFSQADNSITGRGVRWLALALRWATLGLRAGWRSFRFRSLVPMRALTQLNVFRSL